MAKKKNGLLKFIVGVGAAAVAGKVAYDKVKAAKNKLTKEEQDSAELEVRKYNAVCEKRDVEIEDEEFMGCEVKAIASKLTVDLSLAVFEKDVYINFESIISNVSIILPDGVNVTCDIDKKLAYIVFGILDPALAAYHATDAVLKFNSLIIGRACPVPSHVADLQTTV